VFSIAVYVPELDPPDPLPEPDAAVLPELHAASVSAAAMASDATAARRFNLCAFTEFSLGLLVQ
jgi:hypothetical protein